MPRPHQGAQGLAAGEQHLHLRRGRRLQHQGEVRLELRECGHRLDVVAHLHGEGHLRELRPVGLDLVGHHVVDEGLAAGQRHVAAPDPRQVGDLRAHPLQVGALVADVAHQQFARRVEAHALRHPLEDRRAELVFEVLDLPGQRRGRDVEPLRRPADRPVAGHLRHVGEDAQVLHREGPAVIRLCCPNRNGPVKKQHSRATRAAPSLEAERSHLGARRHDPPSHASRRPRRRIPRRPPSACPARARAQGATVIRMGSLKLIHSIAPHFYEQFTPAGYTVEVVPVREPHRVQERGGDASRWISGPSASPPAPSGRPPASRSSSSPPPATAAWRSSPARMRASPRSRTSRASASPSGPARPRRSSPWSACARRA